MQFAKNNDVTPMASQGLTLILPIAPHALARSRFAAGQNSTVALRPDEAITWLDAVVAEGNDVAAVELAGPGDPLATAEVTGEAISLLAQRYPAMALSLSTIGLYGDLYARSFAEKGLKQVTILVDAVTPEIVSKLYAWIRPGKKTVPLEKAAAILLTEQATAIAACKREGMAVHIRTTVYPGVNDSQIEAIAQQTAALGADSMSLVPCRSSVDEENSPPVPDAKMLQTLGGLVSKHLPIIDNPEVGDTLSMTEGNSPLAALGQEAMLPKPSRDRPNVAVVSSNGMDVDLHLGQAHRVMIYGPRGDGLPCLLKTCLVPAAGGGNSRWQKLADILGDCFVLLAASAGDKPRAILGELGVRVLIADGNIEGSVDVLYGGGKKQKCRK